MVNFHTVTKAIAEEEIQADLEAFIPPHGN